MENINFIDLMFAVIIGVSILLGLIRGLFRAVFGILSLVLAVFSAKHFAPNLFNAMFHFIGDSLASVAMAYIFVFIIALLLFNIVSFIFQRRLKMLIWAAPIILAAFSSASCAVFFLPWSLPWCWP